MEDWLPVVTLVVGLLAGIGSDYLRDLREARRTRHATRESRLDRYLDVRQDALLEYDETLQKAEVLFRGIGIGRVELIGLTGPARRAKENEISSLQVESWPTTLRLRALTARIADEQLTDATTKVFQAGSEEVPGTDVSLTYLTDQAHHRAGVLLRELAEKDAGGLQRPDQ